MCVVAIAQTLAFKFRNNFLPPGKKGVAKIIMACNAQKLRISKKSNVLSYNPILYDGIPLL